MGQLGNLSPAASVAVGIIVGLLSTSVQSVGLTLQRKSHLLEDSKAAGTVRRPPYRRRRWQLGMLMFIVANVVGSTIQITTLPLPVLSTLQASGLVFNTICASLILGEDFTRWSLGGTALVAGGAVLIALFGALPEPSHTLDQLLELLGRPQFVGWMVCTVIAMAATLVLALILPRLHVRKHGHDRASRTFHAHRLTPRLRLALGLCYGGVSAVLSSHSLLVAKSAVELLVQTLGNGNNQFNRWQSWMILVALLVLALSQLYFLHRGLKIVSTSILYPFVYCIYNIIAILDGLIYFHQMDKLPPLHAGLIALGTVILLAGVLALSWRLSDESQQEVVNGHHHTPIIGQENLLTPGMGMMEDTRTESPTPASSYYSSASAYATEDEVDDDQDEEALLYDPESNSKTNDERTPLLTDTGPRPKRRPRIRPPRHSRTERVRGNDSESIWNALFDSSTREALERHTWGLNRGRRASVGTSLHRPSNLTRRQLENDDDDADDEAPAMRPRRTRTIAVTDGRWRRSEDQGRSVSGPLPRRTRSGRQARRREGSLGAWLGGFFGSRGGQREANSAGPDERPVQGRSAAEEGGPRGGEG